MTFIASEPTTRLIIGCGYLGRRVASRWLSAGDIVFALTRSSEHGDELSSLGLQPVVGDVLEPATLASLPDASTVLYAVGFDRSGDASKREVYVHGLRNVIAALPASVKRFVYISSTSVYGQSHGERVDESSPCDPTTEGGRICLDAERVVREELPRHLNVHILRVSGLYGPHRLLARIESLREGRPLTVHPEGWLNLIHVDDAATVVLKCSDRNAVESPITLVSDDRPLRRREYYATLAQLVSAPAPTFEPSEIMTPDLGKQCCNRRLHEQWGVELKFPSIETGLVHAIGAFS